MFEQLISLLFHTDTYLTEIIQNYGNLVYAVLFLIIFVETGLVIMPFLPGDSLLFVAGTLAGTAGLNIWLLFILLVSAAIIGDTVNYWLGRNLGEKAFRRFIRPEHMEKTRTFFDRHGKKTIVLARFVPIVRTFAPFVAGIGRMNYTEFLHYNVFGGIIWVGIFLTAGYFFGNIPFIKDNLSLFVLLIVFVSVIPIIYEYISHRLRATAGRENDKQS